MCIQEKPSQFDVRCERCGEKGSPRRMALDSFGTCFYCREETDHIRNSINELREVQEKLETEFKGKSRDAALLWEHSPEGVSLNDRIVTLMMRQNELHRQGQPWPRR